jgi:hypothetical protein
MDSLPNPLPPKARKAIKQHRENVLRIREKFTNRVKEILVESDARRLERMKKEIQTQ